MIFLAESGEEGAPEVGAQFMADNHLDAINAEFCLAEGGGVVRTGGKVQRANIGTTEKEPRFVEIIARGPAGHGSVPSRNNAVTRLSSAVGKVAEWLPPLRINETTGAYFRSSATMVAARDRREVYRDVLNPDPQDVERPGRGLAARERAAALVDAAHLARADDHRTAAIRYNVIPSEAKATIDVRLHPDEDQSTFLDTVRERHQRSERRSALGPRALSPGRRLALTPRRSPCSKRRSRSTTTPIVLPTMGTGATDMAQMRSKGIKCYGIGPALDTEDGPKGFGAHSDQERILESELHRFVRFQYDVVIALAGTKK